MKHKKNKKNFRCAICNSVSDKDIATEVGDAVNGHFRPDPTNKLQDICEACAVEINLVKTEYYIWDDTAEFNYSF